ncbi:hypothetical protein QNO21_06900 [Microbacterium sp. zg-Y818]|uniref:hypothetical protein n=1 Tax=unclassified Microbacterium TaxID=2609290 RepID=UPI00214B6F54|nr:MULTISPECIES: hypothetical protein [unclassified Microbacterium]MCR2801034.1 hypothetical protein [Microbacterium sp. zg.Y818]WIM23739.1 hypothetical protein QNO21_06900 [Microbacterium sp. zg-Y818]
MITMQAPVLVKSATGSKLVDAAPDLWRVVSRDGRVVGHLGRVAEGSDVRYRALRYHPGRGRLIPIGEFWSADDAVQCLFSSR